MGIAGRNTGYDRLWHTFSSETKESSLDFSRFMTSVRDAFPSKRDPRPAENRPAKATVCPGEPDARMAEIAPRRKPAVAVTDAKTGAYRNSSGRGARIACLERTFQSHTITMEQGLMALQPLDDRILVQRVASEEKTAGGILLPDNAKEKPQKGKIVAVGPGKVKKDGTRAALQVKVGDVVIFTSWAGDEVKKQFSTGEDLLIMREEDVLAVID
jgi:chaperonin GroES